MSRIQSLKLKLDKVFTVKLDVNKKYNIENCIFCSDGIKQKS